MSYCDLLVTRNKFREGTSSTYKFRVRPEFSDLLVSKPTP